MVMLVEPTPLLEVMESMPAMVENCRSSGVATEDAMVSGLAPGSEACTWIVGKSTMGRSLTGRARYHATPNSTIPIITSAVMTGRLMKISVIFIVRIESATSQSQLERSFRLCRDSPLGVYFTREGSYDVLQV